MSGSEGAAELSIGAQAGEVRSASAWLESAAHQLGIPADQLYRLDLCMNEALANIIDHAGIAALSSPVHLLLAVQRDQDARLAMLTISDAGEPFNPLSATPKPAAKSLDEVEPGGLGLLMMQSFTDILSYRYHAGRNELSFGVCWIEAS